MIVRLMETLFWGRNMEEAFTPGAEGSECIQGSTKVVMNKDLAVWWSKKEVRTTKTALRSNTEAYSKLEDVTDTVSRSGATKHTMAIGKPILSTEEANLLGIVRVRAIRVTFEVAGTMEWEAISIPRGESMLGSGTRAGKMEQESNAGRTEPCTVVCIGVEKDTGMVGWSTPTGAYTKEAGRKGVAADLGSVFHRLVGSSIAACGAMVIQQLYPNSL